MGWVSSPDIDINFMIELLKNHLYCLKLFAFGIIGLAATAAVLIAVIGALQWIFFMVLHLVLSK